MRDLALLRRALNEKKKENIGTKNGAIQGHFGHGHSRKERKN
jgi:hypothetical protein